MRRPPAFRRSAAGFTLVEMIIVMGILGILAVWGIPALLQTLNRARLVGAAKEIATMFQVARLEAIKKGGANGDLQNRVTAVRYQTWTAGANEMEGLQLVFEDAVDPGDSPPWNPQVPIGGIYALPTGVSLQAPGEAPGGDSSIVGWDTPDDDDAFDGPVFRSDGSALRAGAYRLADGRGNFLEVRIEFPATGKVSIQKWFGGGATDWWENHEAGHVWQW
jgi:prepilin-type N-terminal cleavage/methylation domain-containing protein